MTPRLTKDDILRSRNHVEYFEIEELGGEVPLRPLSDTQWSQVQAMAIVGITGAGKVGETNPDVRFDVGTIQLQSHKAQCLAISFAIADGSRWTAKDIENADWPPGTVDKIAAIVFRLSGVAFSPAEVRSFRGEQRRTGDSALATLRGSASSPAV